MAQLEQITCFIISMLLICLLTCSLSEGSDVRAAILTLILFPAILILITNYLGYC